MREELLRADLPDADDDTELTADVSLRPRTLAEFVGQPELKDHLAIILEAARRRSQAVDHVLLAGPPGLGKTSLAGIIAAEMGVVMHVTSGPAIERAGDLAAMLSQLGEGDVLFIDEIHRLPRVVEEVLYPAMEDFQIDIVLGKGPAARSIRLDLPRFTLVGATTRTGSITGPLPRSLRPRRPPRLLRAGRPRSHRHAGRRHPRRARGHRRCPGDRPSGPRHPPHRQPPAAAACATSPRSGATAPSTCHGRGRAGPLRGGRARPRQGRPGHPLGHLRALRWRSRRALHPGHQRGGADRDRRGRLRAVPHPGRPAHAHPPGTGRHRRRVAAPRPGRATRRAGRRRPPGLFG